MQVLNNLYPIIFLSIYLVDLVIQCRAKTLFTDEQAGPAILENVFAHMIERISLNILSELCLQGPAEYGTMNGSAGPTLKVPSLRRISQNLPRFGGAWVQYSRQCKSLIHPLA